MLMEKDREIITLKSEKESEVKAVKNQYELITRPRSTVTTAFQTNINMAEQTGHFPEMDQQRWSNALASKFTRHNTTGFFPVGLYQEQCVPNTS
ncbi:uncharacterized protein LOC111869808 isoform X2 [Cryptotermes secundus]|uniref:uncharacterized protein LOC111869808 isoform X2 n=1 Tax=Cryptotermes secundus TaxID=105785 RepID=UPI000CD7AC98|nr:uncharacterized protein LOC111869808 isoform X2 [Cryptotermes secundus]